MKPDEVLEILNVYNQMEYYKTFNWQEIMRVYEFFDNKKERFPREKVWRIKSFIENNPKLLIEAEDDLHELNRRKLSILVKNQIPAPKLKDKKIWTNNMNKLLQYESKTSTNNHRLL